MPKTITQFRPHDRIKCERKAQHQGIIIVSLFNVDAKNKVKNYNKKEIIVYIINYNI